MSDEIILHSGRPSPFTWIFFGSLALLLPLIKVVDCVGGYTGPADKFVIPCCILIPAIMVVWLANWKIELTPDVIRCCSLLRKPREIHLKGIRRAQLVVVAAGRGAKSIQLAIEEADGTQSRINYKPFSRTMIAWLFAAVEDQGITIEVPDVWQARYHYRIAKQRWRDLYPQQNRRS